MNDEMMRVIRCKYCGKLEYYGEFRWLSGRMLCRDCYKSEWEHENHKPYTWHDLDGKRPSLAEVNADGDSN